MLTCCIADGFQVAVGRAQPLALPQALDGINAADWANSLGALQNYRLPGGDIATHGQSSSPQKGAGTKRPWPTGTVPVGGELVGSGMGGSDFNQRLAEIVGGCSTTALTKFINFFTLHGEPINSRA